MTVTHDNSAIVISCRDPYYAYDAYHITTAFFVQKVRRNLIRQESNPHPGALVSVSLVTGEERQEIFRFSADDRDHDSADEVRRQVKYEMGCALYEALAQFTGRRLPWGILTGVRPTKIARRWLDEGMEPASCAKRFEQELKAGPDRAELAVQVAGRERELISRMEDRDALSVYIHIPFCPSRCLYCSFASVEAGRFGSRIDPYLDALEREMLSVLPFIKGRPVSCIYVGGGTPTALDEPQLQRLCTLIRTCFGEGEIEWTIEAGRPDTITEEKLRIMKEAGVSRISINPQTMHDETLQRIGRGHTSAQIRDAFSMARRAGFDNINMDLITGLEGESLRDFRQTLEAVASLKPDSVTVHALAVKRASVLGQEKDRPLPAEDLMTQMADEARIWARREKLEPYYLYRQKNMSGNGENIGFAQPGKEGLYNILIMEEVQDILAFGAGAVTKIIDKEHTSGITRISNIKDVLLYINRIDEMIKRKEEVLC